MRARCWRLPIDAAGRRGGARGRRRAVGARNGAPGATAAESGASARRVARRKPAYDADTARLENDLAERLGAIVHIEPGRKGAGRIVIRYSTLDQLDGIVATLREAA